MNRPLFILLLIALSFTANAQNNSNVYARLKQRYGSAAPWGGGYVVNANGFCALADSNGKLVIPFRYRSIDTVLPDRAIACMYDSRRACDIINTKGEKLTQGSYGNYRLMNRRRRIFAMGSSSGYLLCNDSGRQLTYQEFKSVGDTTTMIRDTNAGYAPHGILTITGDTILPMRYNSVSFGRKLYAGVIHDTAYVYERGKGLLCRIGRVHDCNILENDLITVKKYGAWALADRSGKLRTRFEHETIEELRYPQSTLPEDVSSNQFPDAIPGYALVGGSQSKGVIDSAGRVLLPRVHDNIDMNRNGWLIVRKAMHDEEELLDDKHRHVMNADAFRLQFVNKRYVTLTVDKGYDASEMRTYDMVLRKFVTKKVKPDSEQTSAQNNAPINDFKTFEQLNQLATSDTYYVNNGGTRLLRSNGKWGVLSITEDTVLPFIYESASPYNYSMAIVTLKGKTAVLNDEGELATPPLFKEPPYFTGGDSLAYMQNKEVYSYKGGQLKKIDKGTVAVPNMNFTGGMTQVENDAAGLKDGIYNRKLKRIADYPFVKHYSIRQTGIAVITDSVRTQIAIIDSNGTILAPWMPRPKKLVLMDYCALAMYDTGSADVLFRFSDGKALKDSVWTDKSRKVQILFGTLSFGDAVIGDLVAPDAHNPLTFTLPGVGMGAIFPFGGKAGIIAGADEIKPGDYHIARVHGQYGMYDNEAHVELPPIYDSIIVARDGLFLYKNGKTGAYYRGKIYEPAYDHVSNTASLGNRFLIVHNGPLATFLDDDGRVISSGWEDVPKLPFDQLNGLPARKNGTRYQLYPTLGDTLEAVPDTYLPAGLTTIGCRMDGTVIVGRGDKRGVYDGGYKKWIVPLQYSEIEVEDDYILGKTGKPVTSTTMFDLHGRKIFTIKDDVNPQRVPKYGQWYMHGWYGLPIVNSRGKVIVPDTFESASTIENDGQMLYQVRARNDKCGIIDTSGRMILPAMLDYISDDEHMYGGYFIGAIDGRQCLMDPKGRRLTRCIYQGIKPGLLRKTNDYLYITFYWAGGPAEMDDTRPYFIVNMAETDSFGVIDSTGKTLIPCIYEDIQQVHNGRIAVARKGGHWGLVNLKNKPITPFEYEEIDVFNQGYAPAKKGAITGTLTEDGVFTPMPDQ